MSRHSRDHGAEGEAEHEAAAPEPTAPAHDARTSTAPPHPVCRPTLQGHAIRRHLGLALLASALQATR